MSDEKARKKKKEKPEDNPRQSKKKENASKKNNVVKVRKESHEKISKVGTVPAVASSETPDRAIFDPNERLDPREPPLHEQQVKMLKTMVTNIMNDGITKLKEEYAALHKYKPPNVTKEAQGVNKRLSRYKDVACWDQTRVRLIFPPDMPNDFIHANYVNHELFVNRFICTQGPMEHTVVDFWRMVWQEHVTVIIMLCQCFELKKPKCAQYWPTVVNTPKQVHPFVITATNIDNSDPNVIATDLHVQCGDIIRQVEHRHWITWPDKTVPKNGAVAFRLLAHPRDYRFNPSVIHCSAGVGRTGTLLMIELIIQHVLNVRPISIPEVLKELRGQRSQLIQTEDQYVFIHFAMVQYAVLTKVITMGDCRHFLRSYDKYLKQCQEEVEAKLAAKKKKKATVKGTVRKRESKEKEEPGGAAGTQNNLVNAVGHDEDDELSHVESPEHKP
ncbi:unnamed protein product [Bursaphelenchus xylophilus]|uniref:(pine wood nematode) hypothetical protein n=1 Tax=Bursaphelenchus xylophilus TaxID=6326 RepID=A0A1I7SDE8_BURXY|nr:unnamed protein product [Bursaphelenchus xylophilus]CAG9130643.1 unnamed protein product [Bursaphelenchus xylophilus]